MGYIYARMIFDGRRTLKSVPQKYYQSTIDAYNKIYGIDLIVQNPDGTLISANN